MVESVRYRMGVAVGKDEWVSAAYAALIESGPATVTVETLARRMGLTKGSFYWHFADRQELLVAALDKWSADQTDALIVQAEQAAAPLDRLRRLFEAVATAGAGRQPETALYQAAAADPGGVIARAAAEVTTRRIDYVAGLLIDVGFARRDAYDRAHMALAMVIGFRTLQAAVPGSSPAANHRTTALALRLLTTRSADPEP